MTGSPTPAARVAGGAAPAPALDVEALRRQFPVLAQRPHGKRLAYLDSGATSQKPQAVIDAVTRFYDRDNANVHRGVYDLAERATAAFEGARRKVARWIHAEPREVIFTRGTTEAVNLVAQSWGRAHVREGDEILLTGMEHHSNIVPWQLLAAEKGARIVVVPVDDRGAVHLADFERLVGPRTRIVSVAHVSNVLGTVNPVREIVALAHARGVPVLLDGAQAVPHGRVDVADLDADFYAFSGHKMFGPTGVGVLYGKAKVLEAMPPWQGGGDMILSVSFSGTKFNTIPHRFEAGTPAAASVVGLGAAVDWLDALDAAAVAAHEHDLLEHATGRLQEVPGLRIIGTAPGKAPVVSFVMDGVHPHDVGTILDREGVAVRAGHHCAQPLMERFGLPATVRASMALYNTREDVDQLVRGLARVREMFP